MVTGSWVTADYSGENQRGDPLKCQVCTIRSMLQTLANYAMNSVEKIQCFWIRGCIMHLLYPLVSVGPCLCRFIIGSQIGRFPAGDDSLTRCYCLYDSNTLLFLSWTLRSAEPLDSRLPRLPPRLASAGVDLGGRERIDYLGNEEDLNQGLKLRTFPLDIHTPMPLF